MIIPLPPAGYLYAAAFVGGLALGIYGMHTWQKAQKVDAVQKARTTERGFQRTANQADVRYVDRLHEQRTHAEANAAEFKRALNENENQLAGCRVASRFIGLLDDAGKLPRAPGDAAKPGPRAPGAEAAPDGNCARELDTCRANYAEVCVPNAIHVRELRSFTRNLIDAYNKKVGAK